MDGNAPMFTGSRGRIEILSRGHSPPKQTVESLLETKVYAPVGNENVPVQDENAPVGDENVPDNEDKPNSSKQKYITIK